MVSSNDAGSLYGVLHVDRTATEGEIKKAYLRLAMKTHPDKHPGDHEATQKFQEISRAYATLSDKEKRSVYDATGIVDGECQGDVEFWKSTFEAVSFETLDEDKKKYQGSAEELDDLTRAYTDNCGCMGKILDDMFYAEPVDEARFRAILQRLIDSKDLPSYSAFNGETASAKRKREKKAAREAEEAAKAASALGLEKKFVGGDDSALHSALALRIGQRARAFDSLINSLEQRHMSGAGEKEKTTNKSSKKRK